MVRLASRRGQGRAGGAPRREERRESESLELSDVAPPWSWSRLFFLLAFLGAPSLRGPAANLWRQRRRGDPQSKQQQQQQQQGQQQQQRSLLHKHHAAARPGPRCPPAARRRAVPARALAGGLGLLPRVRRGRLVRPGVAARGPVPRREGRPEQEQLAVVAAAMGSGALTLARLLFGHWIPTFSELASAKVLAVFSACSLAVGAAVAFWFDDPGATKAHAILAAALRLVGLGLVAGGVSSPVVGVSLAGALALSVSVGPQVSATVAEWRGRIRERRRAQRQRRAEVVTTAEAVAATATMTATPSPPRRQQASPLLQQQQRSPEAALRQRRRSASVSTAAFESPERSTFPASSPQRTSRGGDGEEGEGGARSRSPTVGPLLFGRRPPAAAAAAAPTVSAPSSSRPPLLFRSAAAVPLPSAHNEEEEREREEEEEQSRRESEQQQRRRTTTTSEHRPPPLQRQQSGWQREEPQQQSHRAAAATASAATPARSFQQRPQSQRSLSHAAAGSGSLLLRSPLVDRGLLLNEATGKTIKIGAATYNRLVLEGYTVDEGRGTLSPPVRARRTGRGRGQEGGEEEEEAGGGTSNLRPRTRNG